MRLLDCVAQCREPVRIALPGSGVWELPGAASFAAEVAAAPVAYVLGDDVRDACQEIMARWPELMDPASPALRVPVPTLWLEWRQPTREGAPGRRTGLLIRSDEEGRSGTVHSFWEDAVTGAELAQAHIRFDLDRRLSPGRANDAACVMPPELKLLAPHALLTVDPKWLTYFAHTGASQLGAVVQSCATQLLPDIPFVAAFLRLLAVRRNLDETHVDPRALNRARAARGKPPLLAHVELSLALGAAPNGRGKGAHARARSRQHMVRGHLVNRGGAIFWRTAHLRGLGTSEAIARRTVSVSMARSYSAEAIGNRL